MKKKALLRLIKIQVCVAWTEKFVKLHWFLVVGLSSYKFCFAYKTQKYKSFSGIWFIWLCEQIRKWINENNPPDMTAKCNLRKRRKQNCIVGELFLHAEQKRKSRESWDFVELLNKNQSASWWSQNVGQKSRSEEAKN